MEMAFPALSGLRGIGCLTKTKPNENNIDSTGTPFRCAALLTDTVAKTCTELTLAKCDLKELPALIGGFLLMRLLDVSENKLEELPPDVGNCFSLRTLNISTNSIKVLPDELQQLTHLHTFFFYSNRINVLPDWLGEMPLTGLNGFNNRILKLPASLGQLRDCSEVNLAANVFMQLPTEAMTHWRAVKVLNLYDSRLVKMCSLKDLDNLEELRLFNNNLEEVPEVGMRLTKLKLVELNKNRITTLPLLFFKGLPALERIILNNNLVETIPVGINCPKLESFLISSNNLTELPPDLPLWPSLRVLFVNNNQLTRLPETFLQNTLIERINLARNSKCAVPAKHIIAHLKKVVEKKDGGKFWAPDTL